MLKIVGICILLFALICVVGNLRERLRHRAALCGEIYEFLRHIRNRVGCYLLPLREIAFSYSTPCLEESGVLDALRNGKDPMPLFKGKYSLSDNFRRVVGGVLSSFGEGYVDEELRSLDSAINELSVLLAAEESESRKRIKLCSVLSAAVGIGSLILFL